MAFTNRDLFLPNRNIFEVMESRIDMVKRQYSGELSEVMSTRISDKESESLTCDSAPSSPGLENVPSISTAGDSPAGSSPSRQRSLSDGTMMHNGGDDDSQERARSFYQLQAQQIYLTHQRLIASDDGIKDKDKDRAKKSPSRSSLLSRKFRRLSRPDSSAGSDGQQQRHSFQEGDAGLYDPTLGNLMGGGQSSPNGSTKRASTGSNSLTAGSLFRWMFMGGQSSGSSSKLSALVSSGGGGSSSGDRSPYSNQSLASQSSTSSLSSLTLMNSYNEQAGDVYRHRGNGYGTSYPRPLTDSFLRYGMKSRKYPDHLTTYAGRALPEHTAVLNEYVDWLAQCHAYGIKSKMGYVQQGSSNGGGAAGQGAGQPGGVPGLGLGTSPAATGSMSEGCGVVSGDFSIFSLSLGKVVDASTVSGHHHDEWISAGMAQMMILRFPGLVVEWPKFWNNSREASGPPPGPITTLTAMAVVNNPMLSLGKGNAGGVGGGVSAGAGGSFGGANLNGSSGNGPSSLKHQQQAQMHHQQQMQLWSRNAAAAAAAAAAASATSGLAAT